MKNLKNLLIISAATLIAAAPVLAEDNNTIPEAQKKQFEQLIHDYLVKNPQVLIEVSQSLQQLQQKQMLAAAEKAIGDNAEQLFANNLTTVGNPKGNVTLVEFFDYQCAHCKKMTEIINKLVKQNPQLRVIYKEFPIFGGNSDLAAKTALAAAMQGKYQAMHSSLLQQQKPLTQQSIMDLAKKLNLNIKKLKQDMEAKNISEILVNNRQLAEKMHLMGTPAFIVASTPMGKLNEKTKPEFVPGSTNEQILQTLINKVTG